MKGANEFLEKEYWPEWNERFARPLAGMTDLHRPLTAQQDLAAVVVLGAVLEVGEAGGGGIYNPSLPWVQRIACSQCGYIGKGAGISHLFQRLEQRLLEFGVPACISDVEPSVEQYAVL